MKTPLLSSQLALSFTLIATGCAYADEDQVVPRNVPPAYTQECAACHVAYPPRMLPAQSWRRIMSGLDRHYGTDAALDKSRAREISAWLQTNAATRASATPPPQDRITRSTWFEREHRNLDASVWKLPSVKSAANCSACHTGAEQGQFDDDNLRVPPGVSPQQRRAWND
jgi:mono/diheme cytochrome c family protein